MQERMPDFDNCFVILANLNYWFKLQNQKSPWNTLNIFRIICQAFTSVPDSHAVYKHINSYRVKFSSVLDTKDWLWCCAMIAWQERLIRSSPSRAARTAHAACCMHVIQHDDDTGNQLNQLMPTSSHTSTVAAAAQRHARVISCHCQRSLLSSHCSSTV